MASSVVAGVVCAVLLLIGIDSFPTSRVGALGAIVVGAAAATPVFLLLLRALSGRKIAQIVHWDRALDG